MSRFRSVIPIGAIRFILSFVLIVAFLIGVFAAGMGAYAAIAKISYSTAWSNLFEAISSLT